MSWILAAEALPASSRRPGTARPCRHTPADDPRVRALRTRNLAGVPLRLVDNVVIIENAGDCRTSFVNPFFKCILFVPRTLTTSRRTRRTAQKPKQLDPTRHQHGRHGTTAHPPGTNRRIMSVPAFRRRPALTASNRQTRRSCCRHRCRREEAHPPDSPLSLSSSSLSS